MSAMGGSAWRKRLVSLSVWSLLGLGNVWGCGARSDLRGPDDSMEADQANGGSGSPGSPSLTAGATTAGAANSIGGSPLLDITKCPSVMGVVDPDNCEAKFMCPGVTFQTVCYVRRGDTRKRDCVCLNLDNGTSALNEFSVKDDTPWDDAPCFTDAPSLCQL
jgi:hypothetical protein